ALAREVRAVDARSLEAGGLLDSYEDGVVEEPRETIWLSVTPRCRSAWSPARLLARRVAGEALSQAGVAEMIAAEVMSAIGVDGDPGLSTPLHLSLPANRCAVHGADERERIARDECRRVRIPRSTAPAGLPRATDRGTRLRRRDRARRAAAARAARHT